MLLLGSRRAIYVPALYFLAGGLIGAVSLAALVSGKPEARVGSFFGVLIGLLSLYFAIKDVRRFTAGSGETLLVRGLGKTRSLELPSCAFGLRLKTGRMPGFIVFVTDSVVSEDVGEWGAEARARQAIARLERSLLPSETDFVEGPPRKTKLSRAKRQVEQIEREWQAQMAPGQKMIAEYYQSKTWRWIKYAVAGALVLYVVGMSLYFHLNGK